MHLNSQKRHFQKHNRKTNSKGNRMFGVKRCTGTSPKQILWKTNSALYSKRLAKQSGSSVLQLILDEATELHATIISENSTREFDPGWFSRTENCTSQFTDKFEIITEVFRALSKLDPESIYLTWPKKCIWPQKSRIFRNTTERQTQNDTESLEQSDALEQVQSKFCEK